jgi:hypothetical protein
MNIYRYIRVQYAPRVVGTVENMASPSEKAAVGNGSRIITKATRVVMKLIVIRP